MNKIMRPVVQIVEGQLRGVSEKSIYGKPYAAFKGIPYAKPPVGELRFQEPKPAEFWSNVKDCSKFGPNCAQYDSMTRTVVGGDDCLYLNVYTPSHETSRSFTPKPVMVWIHGGLFAFGSGDDTLFGPDYIIENDVILVTINYRLGVFGFLNLEDGEVSGNQGLKDQLLALEWVQKNIENFGGDRENVTIFGESAGGASVHYLTLSPLAKGLFHKAISQSGVAVNPWAGMETSPKFYARKLAQALGKEMTDSKILVEFLRSLDAKILVEMDRKISQEVHWSAFRCFVPTVDETSKNPFLPISAKTASHESVDVPFMMGHTSHEGIPWLTRATDDKKLASYNSCLEQVFCPRATKLLEYQGLEVSDLKDIYFGNRPVSSESLCNYVEMQSDVQFLSGIHEVAAIQTIKNKCPTYFYKFSYDKGFSLVKANAGLDISGACHSDELNYIFYSKLLASMGILPFKAGSMEHLVAKRVTEMWTNFAKTGNPTPAITNTLTVEWHPLKSPDNIECLNINENLRMESIPNVYAKWEKKLTSKL
ncbi:juvenile hormone esterase-like isoform X2 [Venturia canescens]|uniref:juvenile hormone esterase-like isoform X2 n=1 Tax=Venturia canescens TaxID=32260 RepID=UPI001C9CD05C|nr:juvenile hormone esterase-like isoform X2 [Venturia canescens]